MATVTGTTLTYGVTSAGGNREDLSDTIYDLFPDQTYALTNFQKTKASGTLHEWLGDTLTAAAANIGVEGDDYAYTSIVSPTRYANYTQIFRKNFIVSDTQEAVSKAGRKTEAARQTVKQMRELKNDVEYAIVRNSPATAGSSTVGRSLGSMENWIGAGRVASSTAATSHVLSTTTASSTTAAIASKVAGAVTDSTTTAALTEADVKLALEGAWAQGGETDIILCSPGVKDDFTAFTGVATRNVDVGGRTSQAPITGAVDVYVSAFGVHKLIQHRHVRSNVCLFVDTSLWAISTLRPFQMEQLAKTGDGKKYALKAELTLESRNYLGNSKVSAIA